MPPRSQFTREFVAKNAAGGAAFREWIFEPGMEFLGIRKWWGDRGTRKRPHEGIDLKEYRDASGMIRTIREGAPVPAAYEGSVAATLPDFIGISVFVRHPGIRRETAILFTLYGHLARDGAAAPGTPVKAGALVGRVAPGNSTVPGHLHLSAAWIPEAIPYADLSWSLLSSARVVLVNPLDLI